MNAAGGPAGSTVLEHIRARAMAGPPDRDARDAVGIVRRTARRGRSGWLKPRHVTALAAGRGPDEWYVSGTDTFWWRVQRAAQVSLGCRLSAAEARALLDDGD